ncbi:MAG: universal stress protein [Alphaproteobacteria bacterium]
MAIKDVMLLLTDAGDSNRLLPLATKIVRDAGASLTAVYITDLGEEELPTQLELTRTSVTDRLEEAKLAHSWREVSGSSPDILVRTARCFDLIIGSQPDLVGGTRRKRNIPEDIVVGAGRPVLLVPRSGEFHSTGSRALIAWDGSREAARALHDAVPLLMQTKETAIYRVNPRPEDETVDSDIIGHLKLMGITATRHTTRAGRPPNETAVMGPRGLDVGDVLLSASADFGADLLVMGAYHHSRAREAVLGGVTHHVFQHMTVPVLMSH